MASGRIPAMLLVVAAALAAASGRPSAQGGQPAGVIGRVEIGIPISTRRAANIYTRSVPGGRLAPTSELRNVVVYLQDAPTRVIPPVRAAIRQEHETFTPRVVAVPVGSTVEFPNDDPIYHNVFSLSRVRTFNLGRFPQGQTRQVRFDKAGLVRVFCEIHSHMSATVMVFDHPWFAVPGDDGRFSLPAVPPGERQITAWHERLGETTVQVQVEAGRDAAADFVLPVPEQP